MSKIITYAQLKKLGACQDQLEIFKSKFGDSVKLTLKLVKANSSTFDFEWAAKSLLTSSAYAEYERTIAPAYAEYGRIRVSAYAEYGRTIAPALAEYGRTITPAYTEYERTRELAYAEYGRISAIAFFNLYTGKE